jgi:hypothetical protein
MSVSVSVRELWDRIAEFGDMAFLITSSSDGRPHIVSVRVRAGGESDGERVSLSAGNTSRTNAAANPAVSLLWSPVDGGDYALIADGDATVIDDGITITPGRAVLHRIATATGDGPSCVTILPGN